MTTELTTAHHAPVTARRMREAALRFLDSLTDEQRGVAAVRFPGRRTLSMELHPRGPKRAASKGHERVAARPRVGADGEWLERQKLGSGEANNRSGKNAQRLGAHAERRDPLEAGPRALLLQRLRRSVHRRTLGVAGRWSSYWASLYGDRSGSRLAASVFSSEPIPPRSGTARKRAREFCRRKRISQGRSSAVWTMASSSRRLSIRSRRTTSSLRTTARCRRKCLFEALGFRR